MKAAYLVVTDLHLSGQAKINRQNYDRELHVVFHKIVELVGTEKEKGYAPYVILLGDVFDKSYKSPEKYGIDSSFFVKLRQMTGGIFVCVGNHELNFYLNNPFWTLVNEIESVRVSGLDKANTQPLGFENVFNVVDRLEFDECVFHFNHYGCADSQPVPGKTNIAFCHKPVYDSAMVDDAEMSGRAVEFARTSVSYAVETLCKYDYAFLGHMHWLYGGWRVDGTEIYALSSLGRPSKAEVVDTFLTRDMPVLRLGGGKLISVQHNYFDLPAREDSVIAEIAEEQARTYETIKRQKEAKEYISMTDDPVHNIRTHLAGNPRQLALFDSLADRTFSERDIIKRLDELDWWLG